MAKGKGEPIYQLTAQATLLALLKTAKRVGEKMSGLSGELGAAVANAVEHKNLHRKAFSIIKQLDRMPPEKLAEFKAHFDHYWDKAGLEERVKDAPRMEMGEKVGGEDEENRVEH